MRKPYLTKKVLEGLNEALSRMEADDLTDLSDEESECFRAADDFVRRMYEWMDSKQSKDQ